MAIESSDEQLLMEYAARGAPDVFEELYGRFSPRLEGPIRRMVCCFDDVLDVIQETFIAVHLKAKMFDGRSAAYTWVFAIARNAALTIGRRSKNRREQPTPDDVDLGFFRDRQPDPAALFNIAQERVELFAAIRQLTEREANIIRLLDMDGLDYLEAARRLGVPIGTVRSRRHRALLRLKELMAA